MRIGIVTDVHDEIGLLARALAALRAEAVDAIVTLGDNTDFFGKWNRAREVAALLRAAGVVGVWGNHDFGLCREVTEDTRRRFPGDTCDYFATLRPRLEFRNGRLGEPAGGSPEERAGCHFSHVEPFLDPERPEDLWTFEGRPEDDDRAARSFAAVPHRVAFMGHFHRWLAVAETGRIDWNGSAPLPFEPGSRYLVVVAPLFRGSFAVLDTDTWVLDPRRLASADPGEPAVPVG
jgi:hypothetical protein